MPFGCATLCSPSRALCADSVGSSSLAHSCGTGDVESPQNWVYQNGKLHNLSIIWYSIISHQHLLHFLCIRTTENNSKCGRTNERGAVYAGEVCQEEWPYSRMCCRRASPITLLCISRGFISILYRLWRKFIENHFIYVNCRGWCSAFLS